MERVVLIKYGELTTKKGNRKFFINTLYQNIKKKLDGLNVKISRDISRMYIEFSDNEIDLVLKSKNNELAYKLLYEINNENISFKTSEYINEGINLEKIDVSNYVILLKIINSKGIDYYNLENNTSYKNIDDYTITKNNENNYINISFSHYNKKSFLKKSINVVGVSPSFFNAKCLE